MENNSIAHELRKIDEAGLLSSSDTKTLELRVQHYLEENDAIKVHRKGMASLEIQNDVEQLFREYIVRDRGYFRSYPDFAQEIAENRLKGLDGGNDTEYVWQGWARTPQDGTYRELKIKMTATMGYTIGPERIKRLRDICREMYTHYVHLLTGGQM